MRLQRWFTLGGVRFPIYAVTRPKALAGTTNGKLPADLLEVFPLAQGGEGRILAGAPARSWSALVWLAAVDFGATLTATSPADTYRSYERQESGFRRRFTTVRLPFRPKRMWNGQWWYQRPGVAGMAVPGTSNHGYGLAIDHALWSETTRKLSRPTAWLRWFVPVATSCGWSWEAPSESWHLRFCLGDEVPETVAEVERCKAAPVLKRGDSGQAVKLWQAIVGAKVDGQFGPQTEAAVKAWQAKQTKWYGGTGLPADGVVDADDWWAAR